MGNNQSSLRRFKKLLDSDQKAHDPNIDIREYVLSLKDKKVGIGLIEEVLDVRFGANLRNLFPNAVSVDSDEISACDSYICHGTIHPEKERSHKGAVALFDAMPSDKNPLLIETSFLATSHSWAHSTQDKNPDYACLGYVYDDIAHYFMADYSNRLNRKLNSDAEPTPKELARAERLLERIVGNRISKYNAQPLTAPVMTEGFKRRVLVCDQAFADASTIYGKVGEAEFEQMLQAAIDENPDAEILVKTHPDAEWMKGKRTGYYAHLQSTGRIRLLRAPANPYALFELVDTVYVGTSQMGLEALFAGKKVVTFGAPFYAGWGLTDDRQTIPHRERQRTLAELFHYFYIWYSIYHIPGVEGPAEIEDVLSFIEEKRPHSIETIAPKKSEQPAVSIIIPVYGVEDFIEECIASVQRQTLENIEIIPVNDCSPDGSQIIIDRLAAEDPRIKPLVLGKNIQLGMVRNRGIEAASGEYVWLLDGDDWLSNDDMLRELYQSAKKNDLDMARAQKAYEAVFDDNGKFLHKRADKSERHFQNRIPKTDFIESPEILQSRHCWTWLYRRDFLLENNIRFVTQRWEERAFLHQAYTTAEAIGLFPIKGPAYRVRANSISHRKRETRDYELMFENFRKTFDYYLEAGALELDHPLRPHLNFQISEFIQSMLLSTPYDHYRELGEKEEHEFILSIREQLVRCDFRAEDFDISARNLNPRYLDTSAYPLMIAAMLCERWDMLKNALDLAPISQSTLYETLLQEPQNNTEAMFQSTLSKYARNELVTKADVASAPTQPKPRVIVHIGATKTGSTFIQHMLEKNRPALLRAGVWFPEIGLFWQKNRPHKQAGHSSLTRSALKNLPEFREYVEAGLALMQGNIHTIIVSSEAFFLHKHAPAIADYFEGYPLEMIAYLRRQDEWANAQYCEFAAGGAVGRVDVAFDEWLNKPETKELLDYRIPLDAWSRKIGRENVKVRVFEKAQLHGNDLVSDFAEATKLPELASMPEPKDRNEASLSATHVELIRVFNNKPFASREAYFDFIEDATTGLQKWRTEKGLPIVKPWIVPDDTAHEIMSDAEEVNQEIAKTYLGRDTALFGPAKPKPEEIAIYREEVEIVSEAYLKASLKNGGVIQKKSKHASSRPATIINYGLFGWRYWGLSPLIAALYERRGANPEMIDSFRKEPAEYARFNWSHRHKFITTLLYPNFNPMGPFGILRIWLPPIKLVANVMGKSNLTDALAKDPIYFARSIRSPLRRAVGRIMFPFGELR
ncbi:glycosyltransferase [Falsihalocynthiibacter sp. SS001]|uniref:capsular polysaccharide export protein, LipB/KpsS family n=1 Tax=Falsihalocynthiibacter sp. SS001 TaxID=3349698 RepID=UPI0036D292AE